MTSIRKAEWKDIDAVEQIYNDIHESEESGAQTIGGFVECILCVRRQRMR